MVFVPVFSLSLNILSTVLKWHFCHTILFTDCSIKDEFRMIKKTVNRTCLIMPQVYYTESKYISATESACSF